MKEQCSTPPERGTPRVDALDYGDQRIFKNGDGYGQLWALARTLERELEICRDAHMANCLAADTLRTEIRELRAMRSETARSTADQCNRAMVVKEEWTHTDAPTKVQVSKAVIDDIVTLLSMRSAVAPLTDETIIAAFSAGGGDDAMPTRQPHAPLLTNTQIVWVVRRFLAGSAPQSASAARSPKDGVALKLTSHETGFLRALLQTHADVCAPETADLCSGILKKLAATDSRSAK